MPANDTHPDYDAFSPLWAKCRDVVAGQEAVQAAGPRYLPRLSGQSDSDYLAYKGRALFYNATQRTLDGLTGVIFRKAPRLELPAPLRTLIEDIDLAGLSLQAFAECLVEEVLAVGRAGVLVDHPPAQPGLLTAARVAAAHQRPFLRSYRAEDILDWRFAPAGGRARLMQVRLQETVESEDPGDAFGTLRQTQIRVLELDQAGRYQQRLFRRGPDGWSQMGEAIQPLRAGQPMGFIPFVFFGPKDTAARPDKPPLLDLVNVNLSHYRTTADLEHGAHFTGLPTAVVTGHRLEEGESLSIGSGEAWVLSSPDARASFLEFTGQGLGALERLLARKEAQMAAIGARLLAPEKQVAEAADTLAIRQSGEQAVLASMAQAISLGLTRALGFLRDWSGVTGPLQVELNQDYLPRPLSPQALNAHVQAWQAGALSGRSLFEALQSGEVLAAGLSYEEEQARKAGEALEPSVPIEAI